MNEKNARAPSENELNDVGNNHEAVVLVPAPSDDPRDPLNWSMYRKATMVAALSLSVFAGFTAPLCGQINLVAPAKLYGKTTVQIAYQISAGTAGMASGSYFLAPLSYKFGRSSLVFWTLVCTLLCQIWAALMTHHNDYNSFIVSRFFSGFFGSITCAVGPRVLVDLFFLHQRGRAFSVFHFCLNLGPAAGPTLSAFISSTGKWTLEFWWTVGLVGGAVICVFLFLHETSWDREPGAVNIIAPEGFLANRWATFFPGTKVTKAMSLRQIARKAAVPLLIAVCPVTMMIGLYTLISFGLNVAVNAMTPVFLQRPIDKGGYGFTTFQSAIFSLSAWLGLGLALIYGHFISDRLPLWVCARNGGNWKPEYRLHALWLPSLIICPLGLGIFGYIVSRHLPWGLLVLSHTMTSFGALSTIPITVNYLCECFIGYPSETGTTANAYRVLFGLSVNFYITKWIESVGIAWAYGMMGIMDILSFLTVLLLLWKGHTIREWSWGGINITEEGLHVVEKGEGRIGVDLNLLE